MAVLSTRAPFHGMLPRTGTAVMSFPERDTMPHSLPTFFCLSLATACCLGTAHRALGQPPQPDAPPGNGVTVTITDSNAPLSDKEKARRSAEWQGFLMDIVRREKATLFFDVPLEELPPNGTSAKVTGKMAMRSLALATHHKWQQIGGVQAFVRAPPVSQTDQVNHAVAWLRSLSPKEKQALINGKLGIAQVAPADRDLILQLAAWNPEFAVAAADAGDRVGLGLGFTPRLEYTNAKGEKKTMVVEANSALDVEVPAAKSAEPMAPAALEPLDAAPVGGLDFGKGTVLPLSEVVEKAGATFGVTYVVDRRIAANVYFLSGAYSQAAFEDALQAITTVPPVTRKVGKKLDKEIAAAALGEYGDAFADNDVDFTGFRDISLQIASSADQDALKARYGAKETWPVRDFLQGRTLSVGEFTSNRPGLAAYLAMRGLDPKDQVTLSGGLSLAIKCDGDHTPRGSGGTKDGVPFTSSSPNQLRIGIQ